MDATLVLAPRLRLLTFSSSCLRQRTRQHFGQSVGAFSSHIPRSPSQPSPAPARPSPFPAFSIPSRPPSSASPLPSPGSWSPTPFITETVGGSWHTYDIFSRLLKERIICLNGTIDDTVSASIVAQLLFLEADSPDKAISLYINSPGGSVTAGLAIYDCMRYIQSEVSTICVGQAASMGSLLLCGGSAGKRYCLPHSSIMIHQPSGGYFGQATDIAIHAKEILRVRGQLNRIYEQHLTPGVGSDGEASRNGQVEAGKNEEGKKTETEKGKNKKKKMTIDEIEKLMERDYFMGSKEALELGIVDEILGHRLKPNQGRDGEESGGDEAEGRTESERAKVKEKEKEKEEEEEES